MKRITTAGALLGTVLAATVLAGPAFASPSPDSSCAAQLNQGGTPNGISQSPAGFLGQFTSSEATSSPGVVGSGTSAAAQNHGDFFSCLP